MKKKAIAIIIIMLLAFGFANICYAENLSELRESKEQIKEELGKANEELENLQIELTDNLTAISQIDLQIENAESEIEKTNSEIEKLKQELEQVKIRLAEVKKAYEKQKDICEKRLVALYEMGETTYLDVLLNSKNITDFISNYYLIGEIAQYDSELLDTIQREKKLVEEINEQITKKQDDLQNVQLAQERTLIALENAKTIKNSYANSLTEEEKALQEKINGYQSQINKIDSQILFLTVGDIGADYVGGEFLWPAPGYTTITSPFGTRVHPILKTTRTHYGIDIGAPMGADAVAANSGVVTTSSYLGAYGNAVIIDHGGGVCTIYAHGSELIAKVGDHVEKGDVVLKVGSTGMSTGPHLHFGVTVNGSYVDPIPYLKGNK